MPEKIKISFKENIDNKLTEVPEKCHLRWLNISDKLDNNRRNGEEKGREKRQGDTRKKPSKAIPFVDING